MTLELTMKKAKKVEELDASLYYWHCRNCGPVPNNHVRSDQVCPTCQVEHVKIRKARRKPRGDNERT